MRTRKPNIRNFLNEHPMRVVDIGSRGGFHPIFEPIASQTEIVGFEPDRDECTRLNERSSREPWKYARVLPYAIAGTAGPRTLYVLEDPLMSSLLPPNPQFQESRSWRLVATSEVECITLDELAESGEIDSRFDFMKLDIQGAELEALQGAQERVLPNLLGLEVESRFVPHYLDQSNFSEVEIWLREQGFELFAINPMYVRDHLDKSDMGPPTRRRISHCDAIYFRPASWFDEIPAERREGAVTRLITLYLLYGFCEDALAIARTYAPHLVTSINTFLDFPEAGLKWRMLVAFKAVQSIIRPTRVRRTDLARYSLLVRARDGIRWSLSGRSL